MNAPDRPASDAVERSVRRSEVVAALAAHLPAHAILSRSEDTLNGRGEVLSFGGQVMKNVAGYDVPRLMAGSMGALGVVCEVSLQVLPIAPATATLAFDCSEAEALKRLGGRDGQPLPLQVRSVAEQAGGHATLYRTSNPAERAAGAFAPLSAPLMRIHRGLKAAFDPEGLFNRGRLYADL